MQSNYADEAWAEMVRETESEETQEVRCARCYGTGLVEVQDQETDCVDCEGYGTVLI